MTMSMMSTEDLYPIGIIQDRYQGTYSGGAWIAVGGSKTPTAEGETRLQFCLTSHEGPSGGDIDAAFFWKHAPEWVSVGSSPNDAVNALVERCKAGQHHA